jgi:cyclic-di-GMP-binding biofilm dispersal mediator protein
MAEFSGKTVMVVGGSRGIGAAIVSAFAAAGARVLFTYAGSEDAAKALAARTGAEPLQNDAGDRDALIACVRAAGPLDVFVYNAGRLVVGDPLELDADAVDRMIDVNVNGAYHGSVEAARTMPDGGRIVLIGSINGDRVPVPGISAYGMTKSALQSMTRGLARDFGPRGITINNVQPGPTDTDMNPADGPFAPVMSGFMAVPRYGTAEDVASLVLYVASPQARGINGAMLSIDGGYTA